MHNSVYLGPYDTVQISIFQGVLMEEFHYTWYYKSLVIKHTYSLLNGAVTLSHLDGMNVAPGTVHTQHLTVDQTNQVLTHLTLHNAV